MKLKSTILALAMSLGFAANATLPQVYLNEVLPATNIASAGWTTTGGETTTTEGRDYVTTDGAGTVTFTKSYSTPFDYSFVEDNQLILFAYVYDGTANITVTAEFTGADGKVFACNYAADKFISSEYAQTVKPTSESGEKSTQVNKIVVTIVTGNAADIALGGLVGQSGDKLPLVPGKDLELSACDYDSGPNAFYHFFDTDYDESKYGHCGNMTTSAGGYRTEDDAEGIQINKWAATGNKYTLTNCGKDWAAYWGSVLGSDGKDSLVYVDADALTVTRDMAALGFGTWYNYTVQANEDITIDLSINAGVHYGSYGIISLGNGGKDYKIVDDPSLNWAKEYTAAAVIYLDGQPMKTTQTSRPVNTKNDATGYSQIASDKSKWTSTLKGGATATDTLFFFPKGSNCVSWMPWYHSAETGEPDYKAMKLTKGTHVIKMKVLCSQVFITDLKFENITSVSAVNDVAKDAEAQVEAYGTVGAIVTKQTSEVYSLTGALVAKVNGRVEVPAGIYVVKAGNAAKKVLVK